MAQGLAGRGAVAARHRRAPDPRRRAGPGRGRQPGLPRRGRDALLQRQREARRAGRVPRVPRARQLGSQPRRGIRTRRTWPCSSSRRSASATRPRSGRCRSTCRSSSSSSRRGAARPRSSSSRGSPSRATTCACPRRRRSGPSVRPRSRRATGTNGTPRPTVGDKPEGGAQKAPDAEVGDPWKLPKRDAAPVGANGATAN